MTDQPRGDARPQPLYGQYATPEEQRARIRQPDATWALETGQSVSPAATPPRQPAPPAGARPPSATTKAAPTRGRLVDRVVTVGLLAYGLFAVVSSFSLCGGSSLGDQKRWPAWSRSAMSASEMCFSSRCWAESAASAWAAWGRAATPR